MPRSQVTVFRVAPTADELGGMLVGCSTPIPICTYFNDRPGSRAQKLFLRLGGVVPSTRSRGETVYHHFHDVTYSAAFQKKCPANIGNSGLRAIWCHCTCSEPYLGCKGTFTELKRRQNCRLNSHTAPILIFSPSRPQSMETKCWSER